MKLSVEDWRVEGKVAGSEAEAEAIRRSKLVSDVLDRLDERYVRRQQIVTRSWSSRIERQGTHRVFKVETPALSQRACTSSTSSSFTFSKPG